MPLDLPPRPKTDVRGLGADRRSAIDADGTDSDEGDDRAGVVAHRRARDVGRGRGVARGREQVRDADVDGVAGRVEEAALLLAVVVEVEGVVRRRARRRVGDHALGRVEHRDDAGARAGVEVDGAIRRRRGREQRLRRLEHRREVRGAVHVDAVRRHVAAVLRRRRHRVDQRRDGRGSSESTVAGIGVVGSHSPSRSQLSNGTHAAVEQALR